MRIHDTLINELRHLATDHVYQGIDDATVLLEATKVIEQMDDEIMEWRMKYCCCFPKEVSL